jgi:pilus assembly protein CpaF
MASPPLSRLKKETSHDDFENLKRLIHGKLVDKLDLNKLGELQGDTLRREIRLVVEHLCDTENPLLNRSERERLVVLSRRRHPLFLRHSSQRLIWKQARFA